MKDAKYIAVMDAKTNEVYGFIDLTCNEVIQKDGFDIRIGYGIPEFKDIGGEVFMLPQDGER